MAAARGDHPALTQAVEQLEARRAAAQRATTPPSPATPPARPSTRPRRRSRGPRWRRGSTTALTPRAAELATDELAGLDERVRDHRSELAAAEAVLAEPGARQLLDAPEPDLAALEAAHRARGR